MANQGEHTAFFYGTLMHPAILSRVIFGIHSSNSPASAHHTYTPALLSNYCRHKVQYCDYPGIIPDLHKTVRGVYVTGLTDAHMERLDVFEGSQYSRLVVEIQLLKKDGLLEADEKRKNGVIGGIDEQRGGKEEEVVKTETYVFLDKEDLEDEEWDFEEFKREKLGNWVNLDHEYTEVDEAVETGPRPPHTSEHDPTGGRGVNSKSSSQ